MKRWKLQKEERREAMDYRSNELILLIFNAISVVLLLLLLGIAVDTIKKDTKQEQETTYSIGYSDGYREAMKNINEKK